MAFQTGSIVREERVTALLLWCVRFLLRVFSLLVHMAGNALLGHNPAMS